MAGFVTLIAACFACGQTFSSNPNRVPSYHNQPICRACILHVNQVRADHGLPTWPVHDDAYEALPEEEL